MCHPGGEWKYSWPLETDEFKSYMYGVVWPSVNVSVATVD